jgi:hypothetical protein
VTIVLGVVFGVLAIFVVSFYAKKELNKVSEIGRLLRAVRIHLEYTFDE